MERQMTIEEIEKQFDAEWVLVEDPQTNENLEVMGGTVVLHCKDRDEFDREALKFRARRWAVLHTGEPPKDMEFAL